LVTGLKVRSIFVIFKKALKLYYYCIMTNHVHLIAASENGSLSNILRDFKSHAATKIMEAISIKSCHYAQPLNGRASTWSLLGCFKLL
jgi:REP element-mobilizing transposase RayT